MCRLSTPHWSRARFSKGKRIGFSTRGELLETARTNAEKPDKPPPTEPVQEDAVSGKDDFLAEIAKYVPAETITLTTLAFAAISPSDNWIWIVAGLGAVANVAYLFTTALASPATPLPRWQFYVLPPREGLGRESSFGVSAPLGPSFIGNRNRTGFFRSRQGRRAKLWMGRLPRRTIEAPASWF